MSVYVLNYQFSRQISLPVYHITSNVQHLQTHKYYVYNVSVTPVFTVEVTWLVITDLEVVVAHFAARLSCCDLAVPLQGLALLLTLT